VYLKSYIFETMQILLLPFSILYGMVIRFRNFLFDVGILKQHSFKTFVINVGNLSAGGTGKSPHVIYLINQLKSNYQLAVLSRGYGRITKGFKWVKADNSPLQVGDEPLQYANLFPELNVAVCENRVEGIKQIESEKKCDVILLDDAFQHRYVKPDFNILITDYSDLFYNDQLLPTGRLREPKSGVTRADVVIVSKSPERISSSEMNEVRSNIQKYGVEKVLFSYMRYSESMVFLSGEKMPINYLRNCNVILVAGIANPSPFIEFAISNSKSVTEFIFKDHYQFSSGDIIKIKAQYNQLLSQNSPVVILTTRKDFMRFNTSELQHLIQNLPLAFIDIEVCLHENNGYDLTELIQQLIIQKNK
jgi:tetraacyldisaccharide 4'-kinase